MKLTKAEIVEGTYDVARWFANFSSEGCYREAIDIAHELGGVEVYNSNDGNSSWSPVPTRTFEFDDETKAQIEYDGVFIIETNEQY